MLKFNKKCEGYNEILTKFDNIKNAKQQEIEI